MSLADAKFYFITTFLPLTMYMPLARPFKASAAETWVLKRRKVRPSTETTVVGR